jgi:hypothetical protein
MVMTVDPVTVWNLPRVLLGLVPESAPLLAELAVEAYDIDPDELGLPEEAPRRFKPEYRDRANRPMSIVEQAEAYAESPRSRALNAALGVSMNASLNPYHVMFEFKPGVLLPALRDPVDRDLVGRCCRFLEMVLAAEDYVSQTVQLQIIEGVGLEDELVAQLLPSAGPLLTEELRRSGYSVP